MINVSGFGTEITIVATSTFPMGFTITKFADDEDPIDGKEVEPIGYKMMYDGELFAYDKAAPLEVSVAVIPGSADDINLKIMLNTKRSSLRLLPGAIPDMTTMVVTMPDKGRLVLSQGTILRGPVVDTFQSSGRRKGNVYTFAFGTYAGFQTAGQAFSTIAQGALELF